VAHDHAHVFHVLEPERHLQQPVEPVVLVEEAEDRLAFGCGQLGVVRLLAPRDVVVVAHDIRVGVPAELGAAESERRDER